MPDQKCTKHAITFQDSIGLTITYDPLISEKVANFEFTNLSKKRNKFQIIEENLEKENITALENIFLV